MFAWLRRLQTPDNHYAENYYNCVVNEKSVRVKEVEKVKNLKKAINLTSIDI